MSPSTQRPENIGHVPENPLALFGRARFIHAPPLRELFDILTVKETRGTVFGAPSYVGTM